MDQEEKQTDWEETETKDTNQNGIEDSIEPPAIDIAAGSKALADRLKQNTSTDPTLSGGDIDARWEMAESQGDETVAGSMPTPGQGNVEEIGAAMGVTYQDNEELRVGEKERDRDKSRWELDPASSEDYQERNKGSE